MPNNNNTIPYVSEQPIYVTKPQLPDLSDYIKHLRDIWASSQVTNSGPLLCKYESNAAQYLDVPHTCAVVNGHLGIESSIKALQLTGEVITTPFTFASTTHAITLNNLRPVFCDIDPATFNIDPEKIESLITKETSAILAVHLFGIPCDVDSLKKIADKYNLKLIYDAAHAFGVKFDNQGIGNFGDMSIFSTHATKVFHTIEGGLITYNNRNNRKILNQLRNFGYTERSLDEDVERIGANYKMSELHAAIGLLNLKSINEKITARKVLFEHYYSELSHIVGINIRPYDANISPNYSYLPVIIDPEYCSHSRNELCEILFQHNIHAKKYFYPLCTHLSCYQDHPFYQQHFPVAEKISDNILCLPIYPSLEKSDISNICNIIRKAITDNL
jgi:dTDP-4-amino-4,6-dideoxygalactose transaminase